jgi:hypothetical protein
MFFVLGMTIDVTCGILLFYTTPRNRFLVKKLTVAQLVKKSFLHLVSNPIIKTDGWKKDGIFDDGKFPEIYRAP